MVCDSEYNDPLSNFKAIHVTAPGTVTFQQIPASDDSKNYLSAHAFAENIHLEWYDWNSEEGGIRAQILNNQLQPTLQEDGLPLRYGNRGLVGGVQTAALEEGCAIIWQYRHSESYYWDELRLQFFDLTGQPLFPSGGIQVNRPGSRLSESNLIRSDGGKASSGIYIIRLESASKSHSRKITLVK